MKTAFALMLFLALTLAACGTAPVAQTAVPSPVPSTPDPALQYVELVWSATGGDDPLNQPSAMALDASDNLYVVDTLNDRIRVFDQHGNEINSWGAHGTGEGQFDFVYEGRGRLNIGAIALDREGNVYVSDTANNRIQKFDSQGNFLLMWGSEGHEEGQFFKLVDIGIDPEGNLVTVDDGTYNFQKFDLQGNFLMAWGKGGETKTRLSDVGMLTFDAAGNLYVGDPGTFAIYKFSPTGELLAKWGKEKLPPPKSEGRGIALPNAVALDTQGNMYVTEVIDHRILALDSDGNFLYEWGGGPGKGDYRFNGPHDILLDGQGYLYISDQFNNRVMKYRLLSNP